MALQLITSTHSETLLRAFLAENENLDPFEKRWIVTSGKGIRTWIKHEIASILGVSANLHFLSPEQAVWSFANLPKLSDSQITKNPFSKERLAWKIRKILPELSLEDPEAFAMVSPFLGDEDPLRKIQLCWEIASAFDGYLHYRPQLLEKWENGEYLYFSNDEKWQALLWRRVSSLMPCPSLHNLIKESNFAEDSVEKLSLFYLTPLSPVHFDAFVKYSGRKNLTAYLLQPTHQYWKEVLSNKDKLKQTHDASRAEDLYLELGPPLLGSLGKSWQKLIFQFEEYEFYDPHFAKSEVSPSPDHTLSLLQNLLLEMPEKKDLNKVNLPRDDQSIQIHSCHGPYREIQVLQDFILDQFNQDPSLKPSDILVLCPNLQKYSSVIEAIFENPEESERKIPFGICDRKWRSESRIIDTFYHILEFAESRATARDFFTLISRPAIRQTFDLDDNDLEQIHWWIEKTEIAWGLDSQHKKSLSLPEFKENTWQHGIDRMLLGFCTGHLNGGDFREILPFDEIEGEKANLLSRFVEVFDLLQELHRKCSVKRTPRSWENILEKYCLSPFFHEDENSHADLVEIRKSLGFLTNETTDADDLEPLSVIRLHLEKTLNEKSLLSRHLTHGVTFSSLRSARGIPAKVICLIGLNGGEFPAVKASPSFDLCKVNPEYIDRNVADEDRLLVLEAILCARTCLYLSFQGQSNKNNETIPPSVVIDEIIEQLDELFITDRKGKIRGVKDSLSFKHPLQAFSRKYFQIPNEEKQNKRFFSPSLGCRSFSKIGCKGSTALAKAKEPITPFWTEPLNDQPLEDKKVRLKEVSSFWKSPCSYFAQRRLLLATYEENKLLPVNERLEGCPLKDSHIKRKLISQYMETQSLRNAYERLKYENLLPPGKIGEALYGSILNEIMLMIQRTTPDFEDYEPETSKSGTIGEFDLEGRIGPFFGKSIYHFQSSKLKGKHCMEGLILHLFSNAFGPFSGQTETVVGATDESLKFAPIDPSKAEESLGVLLNLYWYGLNQPLPFFPNASLAWLRQTIKHRNKKPAKNALDPVDSARKNWLEKMGGEGTEFATGLFFANDPWELEQTLEINQKVMSIIDETGDFIP